MVTHVSSGEVSLQIDPSTLRIPFDPSVLREDMSKRRADRARRRSAAFREARGISRRGFGPRYPEKDLGQIALPLTHPDARQMHRVVTKGLQEAGLEGIEPVVFPSVPVFDRQAALEVFTTSFNGSNRTKEFHDFNHTVNDTRRQFNRRHRYGLEALLGPVEVFGLEQPEGRQPRISADAPYGLYRRVVGSMDITITDFFYQTCRDLRRVRHADRELTPKCPEVAVVVATAQDATSAVAAHEQLDVLHNFMVFTGQQQQQVAFRKATFDPCGLELLR